LAYKGLKGKTVLPLYSYILTFTVITSIDLSASPNDILFERADERTIKLFVYNSLNTSRVN